MRARRLDDADAPSAESAKRPVPERTPGGDARRVRLTELDPYIHISVIGTCLGRADLYDVVGRYAGFDLAQASEFEVHHAAVQMAAEGGRGADALHEVLDIRYGREIRRFESARDETELFRLWRAERRSEKTAGAYWALMTHPHTTGELRQRIAGEMHGLMYMSAGSSPAQDAG